MDKLVIKARDFAKLAHEGQLDDTGADYFWSHVAQVGALLMLVTNDPEIIAAGYLHDTIEDCNVTCDEIMIEFGERVMRLVWMITKEGDKDIGYYFPRLKIDEPDAQAAIMIKMADRLSNISRMEAWTEKRRRHYLKKSQFWRVK